MSRIMILGECMLELSGNPDGSLKQAFAGDTYNTAVYLKRCRAALQVDYLTAIGQDFLSQALLADMQQASIGTDYVLRSADKNLGLYMVKTDPSGERSFAYWRSDSAARQIMNLLNKALPDLDAFYFSGISLAILDNVQRELLLNLVTRLKMQGTRIVFDPNYRPRLWQSVSEARTWIDKGYLAADVAFPGGDDHLSLYGHSNTEDILNHVGALDIEETVLKNGAYGVQIVYQGEHAIVPVERIDTVVDTTAAGDAFNAGYLAARYCGRSVTDAASYAAKVAETVIGYRGAIVPAAEFFDKVPPIN